MLAFPKTIAVFIFSHLLFFGVHVTNPPVVATTTPQIATSTTQLIASTTPTKKTISPKQKKAVSITPKPAAATSSPIVTPPEPILTAADYENINTNARAAIVNILCIVQKPGPVQSITGSGVIIDPRGIILTNAHIAQYWLLQDFPTPHSIQCVIRTGNPAYPRYTAELMYISPTWIQFNKDLLKEAVETGTGEDDFAFLRITSAIDGTALPTFPFIPPNVRENVSLNENVDLASYPAGFLGGQTVLQNLNMASAWTTVQALYTFGTSTTDLVSVGGTVVSQKGASGGAVVDTHGTLVGMISTETDAPTTNARDLRAITLAHINRILQSEIGDTLATFLSRDAAQTAQNFQTNLAPSLAKTIEDELNKN